MADSIIESFHEEAKLLTAILAQCLDALLLVFLTLYVLLSVFVKLVEFVFVLGPFHSVDSQLVVVNRLLNLANHLNFLGLLVFYYFLGYNFLLDVALHHSTHRVLSVQRVVRHAERFSPS